MTAQTQAEIPAMSFARLLRQLRSEARLTQEELAWKADRSPRSISDLERGISRTTRKETAVHLADALDIEGPVRTAFVAAARGKAPASDVLAARAQRVPDLQGAPVRWNVGGDDRGFSLREIRVAGTLLDLMTPAADGDGYPIAVILLVSLMAGEEWGATSVLSGPGTSVASTPATTGG